ncbi:glycosyltransferase family 4 protein [Mycobacterium sp. E342]|uniref:glycosyltransferase family 4 protein n=1 Tax=Mycobacterium sp. E342 TaxID=1834147 RepID=UPI0012EA04E1|nr:glycosyltransferase family 4 protein [Mycobacterium sp. E342]
MPGRSVGNNAPAAMPIRVLIIGNAPAGPNSRGGMATVVRLLIDDTDPRFLIRMVPTFVDGRLPARLWTGVFGILRASALLLFGFVDVLHVHYSLRGSVVRKSVPLFVARLRGVSTIVHCHSHYFFTWFDGLPPPLRRAVRAALRADYLLVLGQSLLEESRSRLRFDESNSRVVYNPVVMPAVAPSPRTGQPLRVVSLGRLADSKGSYDLVRAVGILPDDIRANLRVTLAGDGEVHRVREFVRAQALHNTVDVLGWVGPAERDRLLAESAIFVLASYSEALPMSVLEAMANGVVPVTTAVGAIPEVITDGINGVLVSPGDPDQLAAALHSLIVDAELRNRLAAAANARAGDFDVARWRDALHDVWLAAASRDARPLSSPRPFRGCRRSAAAARRRP